MRIIAHLDMDAFFAAIEERENPNLKGKPVVVGADPKGGRGRGVVSTANYPARAFGIQSAMPISWAYRACPNAIFLRPRHNFYEKVSAEIREIIEKSAVSVPNAKIEQVSIDEFFLDISGLGNFDAGESFCKDLKKKILEKAQLTCSIGIAPNKLVAKIASGFKKPDGLTVVTQKNVKKFLSPLSIGVIPGIGPKTGQKLSGLGIKTISDLRKISQKKLVELFGKWGSLIWEESLGIDYSEVGEMGERKTLGEQTTFARDTTNPYFLRRTLYDLCQDVWGKIQQEKLSPKMIEVTVRYFDFETHSHQRTYKNPIESLYQLRHESQELLHEIIKPKKVRLIGVRAGKWS